MTRAPFFTRRENLVIEFKDRQSRKWILTIGEYPDQGPGEIMLHSTRPASGIALLAHDMCIVASLALQYGVPRDKIRAALLHDEEGGPVTLMGEAFEKLCKAYPEDKAG